MDNDSPVDKLIDEQLASDVNEILETVEAGVGAFASHTQDINNPHQVTKEQVGLGNVDNTSDLDKPISNAVASAINTLTENIGLAVQGVMSAIHTLAQENEKQHQVIKSSVETLKQEAFSAIKTLETDFDSDLETAKEEILDVVDGFKVNLDFVATSVETLKSQTQSAIETNKTEVLNTVSGIKTSLQSAIETNKANTDSAVNTLNQSLNGVKSALQTHNHDEMYVKKGEESGDFAPVNHNHDKIYVKLGALGSGGNNAIAYTSNTHGTWRETPLANGNVLLEGHGFLSNNTTQVLSKTIDLLKQCKRIATYIEASADGATPNTNVYGRVRLSVRAGNTWSEKCTIVTNSQSFRVDVPACQRKTAPPSLLWWEFMGYLA